jgi:antirestriction protein ArdC
MNAHIYEQVTERIITLLTQGAVPWQKPWKARTGLPRNLVTNKSYRGINVFLLLAMSYESPFWLTFRQALQLGGSVRKGEKSCPVVFWKQTTIDDEESNEQKKIRLLRFYYVFNVAQCDALQISSEPVETSVNGIINDKTLIVQAAAQAQKAADFILGNTPDESVASATDKISHCPGQKKLFIPTNNP